MELQEFAKIKKRRFALVSHMKLLIDSLRLNIFNI